MDKNFDTLDGALRKLEPYLFPVMKVGVNDLLPDIKTNSGNSHFIMGEMPDGKFKLLNNCSEDYHLISNEEIIKPFLESMNDQYKFRVIPAMRNHATFSCKIVAVPKGDGGIEILKKDEVYPALTLINSYNGSKRYSMQTGLYRLVCSNGLMVPEEMTMEYDFMHTIGYSTKDHIQNALLTYEQFLPKLEEITQPYKELQEIIIPSYEEFVDETMEMVPKFPKKQKDAVLERITEEMVLLSLKEPTAWVIYNAFNYQLNHNDAIDKTEDKKIKIDREIFQYCQLAN